MLRLKKAAVFAVLICGTLLLTACPSQTNIAKINANPDRYRGKEVGIAVILDHRIPRGNTPDE